MAPLSHNTVAPRAPDRPRYIEIDDKDNVRSTLDLEPDPSIIPPPSRAVTRIVKGLTARCNSQRNSQRKLRNSRRSSADESPVAGPSRLPTLATPASSTETSERVFDRLAGGKGVTEEEWAMTEVCGSCGLRFLRKALREHIQVCAD